MGQNKNYENTYAIYVEKELVGKRVKSSKVKIIWRFALRYDNYKTHEISLRHSLLTGKREIKLDKQLIFSRKKVFPGNFGHSFMVKGSEVRVVIEDSSNGYVYDLLINLIPFYRNPRVSVTSLEEMRKSLQSGEEENNVNTDNSNKNNNNACSPVPQDKQQGEEKIVVSKCENKSQTSETSSWTTNSPDPSGRAVHSPSWVDFGSQIAMASEHSPPMIFPTQATSSPSLETLSPQQYNGIPSNPLQNTRAQQVHSIGPSNDIPLHLDLTHEANMGLKGLSLDQRKEPISTASTNTSDPFAHLVNLNDINQPAPVDIKGVPDTSAAYRFQYGSHKLSERTPIPLQNSFNMPLENSFQSDISFQGQYYPQNGLMQGHQPQTHFQETNNRYPMHMQAPQPHNGHLAQTYYQ